MQSGIQFRYACGWRICATLGHEIRTCVIRIHAFKRGDMQIILPVDAIGGAAGLEVPSRLHIQALGQEQPLSPCENSRKSSDGPIGRSNEK